MRCDNTQRREQPNEAATEISLSKALLSVKIGAFFVVMDTYKLSNENIEASLVITCLQYPMLVGWLFKGGEYYRTKKYNDFVEAVTFLTLNNNGPYHPINNAEFIEDLSIAYECLDFSFPEWIKEKPVDILGVEYVDLSNFFSNRIVITDLYEYSLSHYGEDETVYKQSFNGGLGSYYDSSAWKVLRTMKLRLSCLTCSLCGTKEAVFNCHHKTYERKYQELLSDLVVLCRRCHAKHHGLDEASEKLKAIKAILAS